MRFFLYLWTFPTTAPGLLLALVSRLSGGELKIVDGVLEAHGPLVAWLLRRVPITGGASAMTLGHVVIGRDPLSLQSTRAHERVHVRQAECWGPLFIPAYFIASAIARLRGGDAYRDNAFERQAYRAAGIADGASGSS